MSSADATAAQRVRALATAKRHFFSLFEPREPRHVDLEAELAFMQTGSLVRARHGGEHLEVRCWGDGRPVLLVHGLYLLGGKFRRLVPALAQAGLRPVAVDLPGHGASPATFVDADDIAIALLGVQELVGPLFAVVGHSMGAAWVLHALSSGLSAPRVVCIGAPPGMQYAVDYYVSRHEMTPEVEREFRRMTSALGHGLVAPARAASRMTARALIVHDRDDPLSPFESGQALCAAWPGARPLWTSRLGHYKTLDSPEIIAEVTRFLTEPDRGVAAKAPDRQR